MLNLQDLVNFKRLTELLETGYLERVCQSVMPYKTYRVTKKCIQEDAWDKVTCTVRGIVTDEKDNIVARPFPKFFALESPNMPETREENFPVSDPEVTAKIDGYQGVLYECQGRYRVCTRVGFSNAPAMWAGLLYSRDHENVKWPEGYTPVIQVLAKKFPKVLPSPIDGVVLVALVENETGAELPLADLQALAKEQRMHCVQGRKLGVGDALKLNSNDEAGVVLKWDVEPKAPPLRVFRNFPFYKAQHHFVRSLTPDMVVLGLKQGFPLSKLRLVEHGTINVKSYVHTLEHTAAMHYKSYYQSLNELYMSAPVTEDDAKTDSDARQKFFSYINDLSESSRKALYKKFLDDTRGFEEVIWDTVKRQLTHFVTFPEDE